MTGAWQSLCQRHAAVASSLPAGVLTLSLPANGQPIWLAKIHLLLNLSPGRSLVSYSFASSSILLPGCSILSFLISFIASSGFYICVKYQRELCQSIGCSMTVYFFHTQINRHQSEIFLSLFTSSYLPSLCLFSLRFFTPVFDFSPFISPSLFGNQ